MKLLIVTQKIDVNDDNLGFFHDWLKKFAGFADVDVIANYVGKYELPGNVKVFSLGKKKGIGRLIKILRYQWLLLILTPKSNGIFFHMCPEYVIGAGFWPKLFRKKTLLWYTHKTVNWKLKLAEKLTDKIFTASKESFRLPSRKIEITGHGIDVEKFKPAEIKKDVSKFKIISAGRIAPVKNYEILIDAAEILKNKDFNFEMKIAGAPILKGDKEYFEKLKEKIREKKLEGIIEFVGPIPNKDIAEFYQEGNLFINLSDTSSIDKAILEAMVCGLKILTSNDAFKDILKEENITDKNPKNIADKIFALVENKRSISYRDYVMKNHNLENLINKIIKEY